MLKDKLKKFDKFFLDYLLLPFTMFFLVIVCICILSFTSHAEDSPYFPMSQNENNTLPSNLVDILNSNYSDVNGFVLKQGGSTSWNFYFVVFCETAPLNAEIRSNGYQFDISSTGTIKQHRIVLKKSDNSLVEINTSGYTTGINGLDSSVYNTNVSYLSNHKIYTTNGETLVLRYGSDPVVDVGVAIIPPEPILPDFDNLTPPSKVPPTYSTTDYTWTTPPSFDGSSVENALGSIQNVIGWLANNLKEEFKNLTDNFEGFFKYIGETIQYYAGIIIDTLNNFITNFYDNMSALVQPIFEKIAYITEELDAEEVNDAFNNTSLIGLKNQFTTVFTTFETAFDISEPSTFTLTINIQNIDTFYNFGCRSPVIIHLDDHFIPIRTALRTFLWIFISFGTVFIVERGLSDWLRGENDTK